MNQILLATKVNWNMITLFSTLFDTHTFTFQYFLEMTIHRSRFILQCHFYLITPANFSLLI